MSSVHEEEVDEELEIKKEIAQFEHDFPNCPFKILDKIGQGIIILV